MSYIFIGLVGIGFAKDGLLQKLVVYNRWKREQKVSGALTDPGKMIK